MAKLIIEGHSKSNFNSVAATFVTSINPEQIQISRGISYNNEDNGTNTAGNTPKFKGYDDDQVSFDLFFDGTGLTNENGSVDKVDERINKLHQTCYIYQGSIHKPYYIKLRWGSFIFNCTLKSISTSYTLFKKDGTPIRAKVSLSFIGYTNPSKKESQAFKRSPDMTHLKTVRAGDNLPQMCKDIYGEMEYFQQIAQVNSLVNFRNLEVGSQLYFPPLEK